MDIEIDNKYSKNDEEMAGFALASIMEELGFGKASVHSIWTSPTRNYYKVVFQTEKCPVCKRSHDRPQAYWSQYFAGGSWESEARGEHSDPPRAFVGCFRHERKGDKEVVCSPMAFVIWHCKKIGIAK